MLGRGTTTLVLMLVGVLASACFGPEEKTRIVCPRGVPFDVFFTLSNTYGKHASMDLPATDAAGVCQKMSEAALQTGLKVQRVSPTEIVITGTDRVTLVYIAPGAPPGRASLSDLVEQEPVK